MGLYGVLSHGVAVRSQELGVRLALGATRRDLLCLAIGHGLKLAVLGIALGTPLALALARTLEGVLYGARASDSITFAAVPALLLAVASAASLAPALRASRTDPLRVLRAD